jgi:DNA-binding PadR family transcriptional regulator
MYELFILSKLLHRPMHPYRLQLILNAAIGPFRTLSWGTLYPLMKRLEKAGYIVAVDESEDDPRGKKRYRATEAGKLRFLQIMNANGEYESDFPSLFRIKLGCFGHISEEARRLILTDYSRYLTEVMEHSSSMVERIKQEPDLPPDETRFALLALEHQRTVSGCELQWIQSLLNKPTVLMPVNSGT